MSSSSSFSPSKRLIIIIIPIQITETDYQHDRDSCAYARDGNSNSRELFCFKTEGRSHHIVIERSIMRMVFVILSSCEDYYVSISSYYDDPVVQVQRTQKSEQMMLCCSYSNIYSSNSHKDCQHQRYPGATHTTGCTEDYN